MFAPPTNRAFGVHRVFDASEQLAIEGTMTVVVMRNGAPTEIPPALRAALAGEA